MATATPKATPAPTKAKPRGYFLLVARLPGEIVMLRRGLYLAPDIEVQEVLVRDLNDIRTRKYVGGCIGPTVVKEDRALCKAIIAASAVGAA
jgi:hypothetical protein